MACHVCGRAVAPDDRFCTGCGARLGADAAAVRDDAPTDGDDHSAAATDTDDDAAAGVGGDERIARASTPTPASDATAASKAPDAEPAAAAGHSAPTDATAAGASTGATVADRAERPTELVTKVDDGGWGADDPVWAATAAVTVTTTSDLPSTEPITEVWMESVPDAEASPATPYDFVDDEPGTATQAMPASTAEMPVQPATTAPVGHRFRFVAVTLIAIVTALITLGSLFVTIISVTSDRRLTIGDDAPFGFRTGTWIIDDLADNLSIAGLVVVITMIVGGIASAFGWRWGSGLAGGAGLALAGLVGLALGLAQIPIDAAEEFARIPPDEPFTLTITRDVGYWALLVAAALGIVLFFASINDAIGDRRPGLNPWIAALGALATVVAAVGPLLPENLAVFSDNWYITEGPGEPPALLLAGRLLQLGLFLVTGVVGFLCVRRWGLGLAIGGALPMVWLATSTLFDLTDAPIGPAFRNPGADDMHLHGVTTIGVSAVVAMSVLAVIAAYDQSVRERH